MHDKTWLANGKGAVITELVVSRLHLHLINRLRLQLHHLSSSHKVVRRHTRRIHLINNLFLQHHRTSITSLPNLTLLPLLLLMLLHHQTPNIPGQDINLHPTIRATEAHNTLLHLISLQTRSTMLAARHLIRPP